MRFRKRTTAETQTLAAIFRQERFTKQNRVKLSTTGILITFLTLLTTKSMGQRTYSIGDKVKRTDKVEILTTTPIQGPFVRFTEKRFILIVSKMDLIQATKETAALFDKDELKCWT